MDVEKNTLVTRDALLEMEEEEYKNYIEVPKHLNRAARRKLAGGKRAKVSFTSGGKLSRWAKKQRELRAKKENKP